MPWKDGYTTSDEKSLADHEVRWPEGRQCACVIVIDLSVASGPAGITPADLTTAASQFGTQVGLPSLLEVLQRFGMTATFAVPAVIAAIYPATVSLPRTTGHRPAGWYSLPRQRDPFAVGTISPHTIDLLLDAGYQYMGNGLADDIPYYWVADVGTPRALLTLPYYYHFDDQFFLMFPPPGLGSGLENPKPFLTNCRLEFDAQYKRGRYFSVVLHPSIIGFGHRMRLLETLLRHLQDFPGIWNPTAAQCAHYWHAHYPASTTLHLEPSIWQDYPGSLS